MRRFSHAATVSISMALAMGGGLLGAAGCDQPAAPALNGDEALALLTKAGPRFATLTTNLTALEKRVSAIKSPEADGLMKRLTGHKTNLAKYKATMDGFTAKVQGAVKNANAAEMATLKKTFLDEVEGGFTKIETDITDMGKSCTELEKKVAAAASAVPAVDATSFAKKLSTGYELKGAADGIEYQLCGFVDDAKKEVDKTTWFNFDRLTFASGGAELDMEKSKDQLTNMTEVLKAYPKLKLKIGGYTDNTGKADANKKLSQSRAEAVKKALVAGGVDATRLEAEGYGSEHPVCEKNDTDECKAKNRRIAVRVTAK